MRRVTRLRQPRQLLVPSSSTPTSTAAQRMPASLRAVSTTPARPSDEQQPKRNRLRESLWKGEAPGPADPYAQPEESPSSFASPERRDLEAYEAELAELESQQYAYRVSEKPHRPASRLKTIPPRSRAPTSQKANARIGYAPATSADDLEEVGGLQNWWDREGHWGPESRYSGFAAAPRVEDHAVAEVLVRQAVLETLAFRREHEEDKLTAAWQPSDRAALERALALRVKITDDGIAALRGNSNVVVKALVPTKAALRKARREAEEEAAAKPKGKAAAEPPKQAVPSPEEARELIASFEHGWKDISLADPRLKFAVNKRIFQLTGHLIPDAKLARAETVSHLIGIIVRPPPPQKVLEAVRRQGAFEELSNVSVHERRVTPIDREKAVGRWKLIEEELQKRDLPLTGHEGLEGHKEVKWAKGGV